MSSIFIFAAVFLWILPMFVAMAIWHEKGGSSGIGFLMGFALGWIGVVIAAVASPTPTGATVSVSGTFTPGATKTCPRCAEDVKEAAVVCRFCGHEFSQPEDVGPVATFEGEAVTDIKEHSFGVSWGKTAGGRTVFKESAEGEWRLWQTEESPLVPPNGYR